MTNALTKIVLFALAALAVSAQNPASEKTKDPQYYDKPTFIAAGVTDYTSHGAHGSDTIERSADALAKATASLSADAPDHAVPDAQQHHASAIKEEQAGHAIEALGEYQRAADLDPSEQYIFDFADDLLKHHAAEQAAEVFTRGVKLYPHSVRMLLGCAAAWYARGKYDEARERFFEATDLNPKDPTPYLFLGQAQSKEIAESAGFAERMERFARLHPENAWANYYHATSVYRRSASPEARSQAQALLEKAVLLDPHLGAAWLQLGILFADANDYAKAVSAWRKAVASGAALEEAHYRLAQAYRHLGQPAKAQAELELYQELSKKSAESAERERSEMKQFVFAPQAH